MKTPQAGPAPHDPPTYTVDEFCKRHHIARSYFYYLQKTGQGPQIYKLGRSVFRKLPPARW